MIVVMREGATKGEIDNVVGRLEEFGFAIHKSKGVERTIIGAIGEKKPIYLQSIEAMDGVERLVPILEPYKLVSHSFQKETTKVPVGDVVIGGDEVVVIAGPCAVESRDQLFAAARGVKAAGAQILRGGAFKPRTSPYSFQGLEEEGLKILAAARDQFGLPTVTEVVNPRDVELVEEYADMLQVGARNMQNFTLLREVGKSKLPVLLKRGLAATIEEWLMAAEYILSEGNRQVVLCERGIRTYETATRNTLDLSAVPLVKELGHLPIIVDPSHATGQRRLVAPMSRAAIAAGADGIAVEVHPDPGRALSDGPQSLNPQQFQELMEELGPLCQVLGRKLGGQDA
jgi:3-deoxy-7-phosphoheptulonate synthase